MTVMDQSLSLAWPGDFAMIYFCFLTTKVQTNRSYLAGVQSEVRRSGRALD